MAKPVLDMVGEISALPRIESFCDRMNKYGYEYKGEFGISARAFFTRPTEIAVHLHLFPKGHFQVEKHILFRDYLIAHPVALREYSEKKAQLIKLFPEDRNGYQNGKSNLIHELTRKAYQWANKVIPASL